MLQLSSFHGQLVVHNVLRDTTRAICPNLSHEVRKRGFLRAIREMRGQKIRRTKLSVLHVIAGPA